MVNAELPLASRYHVVEEFNRGVYDVIVATDEGAGGEPESRAEEEEEAEESEEQEEKEEKEETNAAGKDLAEDGAKGDDNPTQASMHAESLSEPPKTSERLQPASHPPRSKRRRADPASSLARGIDFTSASSVINFDLPTNSIAYMHRVGRTARAGHSGLALSFIVPRDQWGKDKVVSLKTARNDETVWERITERNRTDGGGEMREWDWGGRKGEVEGFRYRVEGALRAVTGKRVAEARREEVRRELLNSEKLKVSLLPPNRDVNAEAAVPGPLRSQSSRSELSATRCAITFCKDAESFEACTELSHAKDCRDSGTVWWRC